MTNDNDNLYYLFTAAYNLKPHRFSLNMIYARDRLCPDCENEDERQKTDAFYITPAWEGRFGILRFIAQGSLVFGEVERGPEPSDTLDIFAGAAQIAVEAKLGKLTPFFTFLYASGDDDPFDDELNGYDKLASKEVAGVSSVSILNTMANSSMFSGIEQGPTHSQVFGAGASSRLRNGDNAFNANWGFNQSYDVLGGYANPGTIVPAIGVKFALAKGWRLDAHWAGMWVVTTETIEEQLNRENGPIVGRTADIDNFIYHEFGAMLALAAQQAFRHPSQGDSLRFPATGRKTSRRWRTRTTAAGPPPRPAMGKTPCWWARSWCVAVSKTRIPRFGVRVARGALSLAIFGASGMVRSAMI